MFLAWFQRSLWKHHMSVSDPTRQTGAAVWAARRRGPLRLRALVLSSAHAQAAAQQVRHPHERRLLLGEWGSTGGPAATSCDISGFPNGYSGDVFSFLPQALGCSVYVPTVSVSEFLDQLIDLFCFYNGPVRQSYQVQLHKYFCFVLRRFKKHLHQPSQKDQDVWQHNQWQVKGEKSLYVCGFQQHCGAFYWNGFGWTWCEGSVQTFMSGLFSEEPPCASSVALTMTTRWITRCGRRAISAHVRHFGPCR